MAGPHLHQSMSHGHHLLFVEQVDPNCPQARSARLLDCDVSDR
jgi:hypothetical protein